MINDHDIHDSLLVSKEWKKDLETFASLKATLDMDMVTTPVEADINAKFKHLRRLMSYLLHKNLGLFSLTDTKIKGAIKYPEAFTGRLGENIFKFIKDFKEAIVSDHVRKVEQAKTLIKCLKGNSKLTI